MRKWERAFGGRCGGPCGRLLKRGEPVLVYTLVGISHRMLRCEACAEGEPPPPAELPPLPEAKPRIPPLPFTRFSPAMLPIDWKGQAAGREPGEEG